MTPTDIVSERARSGGIKVAPTRSNARIQNRVDVHSTQHLKRHQRPGGTADLLWSRDAFPIRYSSTARAASRPSEIAHTTRD